MTQTQLLKDCPYRQTHLGNLFCTVAILDSESSSRIRSVDVCNECSIPAALEASNCEHFSGGQKTILIKGIGVQILKGATEAMDCLALGFQEPEDYKTMCSECTSRSAIHLCDLPDLPTSPQLPEAPTDRDIREGILVVLFGYHALRPERFGKFDVTPAYIARHLSITELDVVRVAAPMEERGEIRTMKSARERYMRYLTLTAKGVEELNSEPIFTRRHQGIHVGPGGQLVKIDGENNQVALGNSNDLSSE